MKIDKDVSSYYSIEIDLSGANTLTLPVDGPLSEVYKRAGSADDLVSADLASGYTASSMSEQRAERFGVLPLFRWRFLIAKSWVPSRRLSGASLPRPVRRRGPALRLLVVRLGADDPAMDQFPITSELTVSKQAAEGSVS